MSSDVPFTERTADCVNSMESNGEEIVEAEAAAVAEVEKYRLKTLDFSSRYRAENFRENKDRGGEEEGGGFEGERISRVRPLPVLHYHRNMVIYQYCLYEIPDHNLRTNASPPPI